MSAVCIGVIPARLASTRLPRKPLADIEGQSLIQRVWGRAVQASILSRVIIATDSQEIIDHARAFGAEAMFTSPAHPSGTDRVAEVVQVLKTQGTTPDVVVNIQGDVPFLNPAVLEKAVDHLLAAPASVGVGTVATPITSRADFENPSVVKVLCDVTGCALYFSRSPIPYWRDYEEVSSDPAPVLGFKHIGLYVYRPSALHTLGTLSPTFAESRERLEQLRALESGMSISVQVISSHLIAPSIEVDTPQDLERARAFAREP